jgi:hypothetical protein
LALHGTAAKKCKVQGVAQIISRMNSWASRSKRRMMLHANGRRRNLTCSTNQSGSNHQPEWQQPPTRVAVCSKPSSSKSFPPPTRVAAVCSKPSPSEPRKEACYRCPGEEKEITQAVKPTPHIHQGKSLDQTSDDMP